MHSDALLFCSILFSFLTFILFKFIFTIGRLIHSVGNAKKTDAADIEISAANWGKAFLDCDKSGMRGFQEKHFTPYAHFLMTHAGRQCKRFGELKKFNGEGLERSNDEFKKNHMRRTNCKDIATSLRVHKRWELAKRNRALSKKERNDKRPVKMGCQVQKSNKVFLRLCLCVSVLVSLHLCPCAFASVFAGLCVCL